MSTRRLGNYQITEYVGGGGFGSVFRAEDVTKPGRTVALKELHKKHTRNASIKQRFFQEAVAMARLDHPNLPRLFTFGEDNGSYYLVMEFLSGKLLTDEINERGSLPPDEAVAIIVQVLEALGYAHRSGIIHRDLKPDNIMLLQGESGLQVKVLDFGIARMVGGENLTVTGEGFGTPAYMSPERIAGASANDPRIDIYSVGIILYEMLSGKAPFGSTASDPAIYWMEMRSQHEEKPLPSLVPFGVPVQLDEVVQRAAAKRLEDRYPSGEAMLADLKLRGLIEGGDSARLPVAKLCLSIQPGNADVYVDDAFRGRADERGKIVVDGVDAGLHNVKVTKEGYTDYRISVALEEGRQTELQVALAARPTMAIPPAAPTLVAGFETVRFQGGDEARTALLVLDSLPTGTQVFVGDRSVALADQDGKATIRLLPGDHDIRVATPSGESVQRRITLTNKDTGSQQVLTLPLVRATTTPPPQPVSAARPVAASGGKRWAAAGVVILLLALAGSAGYVFVFQRGRPRPASEQSQDNPPQQIASAQPSQEPASQAQSAAPGPDADAKQGADLKKELQDTQAQKDNLEKKLAAEERKKAEQPQANPSEPKTPEPAKENVIPTPPVPASHPESVSPDLPRAGGACLMLNVSRPNGQPGARLRVLMTEQSGDRSIAMEGLTNNLGIARQCGFTPNHQVKVSVFGPRGGLLGEKSTTLAAGRNFLDIVVVPPRNVGLEDEPNPLRNRRRRP